jgi:hypothetical protein
MASPSASPSLSPLPLASSCLSEIWSHHTKQLDRIDALEKRLNEKASHARRRIASLLDQAPTHRRSHLRVFVTHKVESHDANPEDTNNDQPHQNWALVIEGKLLIGLLDHKSAAMVEQEGARAAVGQSGAEPATPAANPSPTAAAAVANNESKDEGASAPSSRSDRNQYKSGEKEEDPVEPTHFTHFFDKVVVQLHTIYQPKTRPNAWSATPKKKTSRSTKRKSPVAEPQDVAIHPRHLTKSKTTKIVWTKDNTPDAHAFQVSYSESDPPPPDTKFHSVVATITLHPTRLEPMYKPCNALADRFFPKHRDDSSGRRSATSGNKRKKVEGGGAAELEEEPPSARIKLDNEIYVPALLTMDEITMALFQYIQDKNLVDPTDHSVIECDKTLSDLFECETLKFSELQELLVSKDLVTEMETNEDPIALVYVMTEKTISPQEPTTSKTGSGVKENEDEPQHSVLSFDMDVYVPGLFHYRVRELMRRIKRREFEYTSSRTKARYLLVASRGNEDLVKTKIEQVVLGRAYAAENIPVHLALAKAAPPNSEARLSAQTDSKICSLMEKLEEYTTGAEASWSLLDACRKLGQ